MDQDTPKQRRLTAKLSERGLTLGWRRYLLQQREDGLSQAQLAAQITAELNFPIDPTTVAAWEQQAKAETRTRPGT